MSAPSFENFLNKFKQSTKQAADQMGRAAKIAKLRMDLMTLTGERVRHLQTIGTKTFSLFCDTSTLDGGALLDRVRNELVQIQRIDVRMKELEVEIADLQAMIQHVEIKDITDENAARGEDEKGEQ